MTLAACTVLVVEDHEFQRRTMLQILANLGVGHLLEAADGEEALSVMHTCPPDVVLCDLDMPGMDGVAFFGHLAARDSDAALIIASGLEEGVVRDAETTASDLGLRILGVVRKPLTARRLLELFVPGAATRSA